MLIRKHAIVSLAGFGLASMLLPPPARAADLAHVFDCGGRFLTLEVQDARVVRSGSIGGIPAAARGRDGCLATGFQLDPDSGTVYAAVPTTATAGADGRRHYKVVALRLPSMSVLHSRDLPEPLLEVPELLLDRRQRQVLVHYRRPGVGPAIERNVVQRWSASLQPQARDATPAAPRRATPDAFSSRAYLDARGRLIDRDRILDPARAGPVRISGYALLTESVRRDFRPLERTGATGQAYLDATFADSAAGRMLFLVGWDTPGNPSPAGGGLMVYDVDTQKVLSAIVTSYQQAPSDGSLGTPTALLSPDGKLVVAEQYEWRPPTDGAKPERFKTGRLAVYDAASGRAAVNLELTPAPGFFGRILGFSADSSNLFYASGENLFVADLRDGQIHRTAVPDGFVATAVLTSSPGR